MHLLTCKDVIKMYLIKNQSVHERPAGNHK